jgi:hypothetical protein
MEKVFTGCELSCAIKATIVEESTPPERNAPSGTSEIILSLVDSRKMRRVSASASSSEIFIFLEKSGEPVSFCFDFAVFPAQPMRRFEFADLPESGLRRGNAQKKDSCQWLRNQLRAKPSGCDSSARNSEPKIKSPFG